MFCFNTSIPTKVIYTVQVRAFSTELLNQMYEARYAKFPFLAVCCYVFEDANFHQDLGIY